MIFLIQLLLLLLGDIEMSPGPDHFQTDALSILHLKLRSIRNKIEFICDSFLDFDILCFTETHLDERVLDETIKLSNKFVSLYIKDRTNHGSGEAVYIANCISHARLTCLEMYCNESIWIELKIKSEKYLLGNLYSPITPDTLFSISLTKILKRRLIF